MTVEHKSFSKKTLLSHLQVVNGTSMVSSFDAISSNFLFVFHNKEVVRILVKNWVKKLLAEFYIS